MLKDLASELLRGKYRLALVAINFASAVPDATHNTNKLGMGIIGILLNLIDDPKRSTRVSLLGGKHQADAFPGHAVNYASGIRIRGRVIAKSAVKECLHLGG